MTANKRGQGWVGVHFQNRNPGPSFLEMSWKEPRLPPAFSLLYVLLQQHSSQFPAEFLSFRRREAIAQSCPTLCYPIDCNPPGSSVHGIFQARILVWVAISFSRGSSGPRDWTQVSCIAGRVFIIWATREALSPHKALCLQLCFRFSGPPTPTPEMLSALVVF